MVRGLTYGQGTLPRVTVVVAPAPASAERPRQLTRKSQYFRGLGCAGGQLWCSGALLFPGVVVVPGVLRRVQEWPDCLPVGAKSETQRPSAESRRRRIRMELHFLQEFLGEIFAASRGGLRGGGQQVGSRSGGAPQHRCAVAFRGCHINQDVPQSFSHLSCLLFCACDTEAVADRE